MDISNERYSERVNGTSVVHPCAIILGNFGILVLQNTSIHFIEKVEKEEEIGPEGTRINSEITLLTGAGFTLSDDGLEFGFGEDVVTDDAE